jgi:hypothetical protein
VHEADLAEGLRTAWKLYQPAPYQRRELPKPHGEVSHEEIGRLLGVSKQAVAQLEARALRKCRAWCRLHGYELEDLLGSG